MGIQKAIPAQLTYSTQTKEKTRHLELEIKARANGPNIVGQQHPTLLGPTML